MDGVFACPECGYELELRGLSPGRQVQCGWCETWVEVPYIPRNAGRKRFRRSSRKRPAWLVPVWGAVALLAIVLVIAGGARWVRSQARAGRERTLAELTASAKSAEAAGRLDQALAETEAALDVARAIDGGSSPRVNELRKSRDAIARREFKARLAAADRADPHEAIGECLTLLERIAASPALADQREAVRETLDRVSQRSVAQDLGRARQAFEAGRPGEALRLCERVAKTTEHLAPGPAHQARDEATGLVSHLVEQHGIVLSPIHGQLSLSTPESYTAALRPILADQLEPRGYLPCPSSSRWCSLWERLAPYQLDVEITEHFAGNYMQSPNRITQIRGRLILSVHGSPLWDRLISARTQSPLPKMTAFQGTRAAVNEHPSPEFERLLYDNAHAAFLEQLGRILRQVPECSTATAPSPQAEPGGPGPVVSGR